MWSHRVGRAAIGALATLLFLAPGATGAAAAEGKSGRFHDPTDTDARYFPLKPGQQFVYEGTVTDAEGSTKHTVIFTVTDLVKKINGVRSRVIWDQDLSDGELAEEELAFMAQDDADNVWTMGEYPEEFENGEFVGAPSTWISGVRRAKAGVLVPGHPKTGTPSFVQGRAPAVEFYDVAKVKEKGRRVCVPVGCYSRVVVIEEWNPTAPGDGKQLKYYAPRVGLIRIDAVGGDAQEVLVATKIRHLGPTGLRKARAEALRLEKRAYKISRDYAKTPPARRDRCR